MKKLITMALAAISVFSAGTANAACEYVAKDTAWVYKWKFSGKTTYSTKAKAPKATGSCGYAGETCTVRCPSSLKIQGYTWVCSPGCGDEFGNFAEVNEVFWSTKPGKFSLAGGVQNEIMHIIGKKAKQGEVAGTVEFVGDNMTYRFTYAGLGKYDKKNSRLTSASGNFAGYAIPCECASSAVWTCDSLSLLCGQNPDSVVFGKWSVKYQKSDSKKFAKNGKLPKFPHWVAMKNLENEEAESESEEEEDGGEEAP